MRLMIDVKEKKSKPSFLQVSLAVTYHVGSELELIE